MPPKKSAVKNPRLATLRRRVAQAPEDPGVYRWLDEEGTVLYVGKAKNLRNRLRSYVSKDTAAGPWKQSFLEKIADFELTVTNTEVEALIFETNQIKEYRPKYNVLMKDDKNYIYAKVTVQDPFPRVEAARRIEEDGSKYFGPMSTGGELWAMLTMLRSVFPFRTCGMEIEVTEERVAGSGQRFVCSEDSSSEAIRQPLTANRLPLDVVCKHKDRPTPCLDFHILKCSAPCTGTRTPEEYSKESIEGVIRFLKGDYESVRPLFEEKMRKAATDKKFELAAQFRDYLGALDRLEGKQLITDTTGEDSDIIAVALLSGRADVVVMRRRNGRLVEDLNFSLAGQAESAADVLEQFLPQFYAEGMEIPEMILVSETLPDAKVFQEWLSVQKKRKVRIILPARGRKSQLLQLAEKNVQEKARQREVKWEAEKRNTESALQDLQSILLLPALPERIEGYDISHLGGTETVGSMVVMVGGKARNDQYRSFTIRSVKEGEVDDYKALKEVLRRRLRHLAEAVREEEKTWVGRGIMVRRARKADVPQLGKSTGLPPEQIDPKEFFVADREGTVVGTARLFHHPTGTIQLRSFWVSDEERGSKLGQFLLRSLLASVKKGKVYLVCDPGLAEYYRAIGFEEIRSVPPVMQEGLGDAEHYLGVFDAVKNKQDPSLTSRPDLLVIDGGKGQLSSALEILKELNVDIPVLGLAKREEEVFVPAEKDPVAFPKDSQAKFLLMRLRDEAHRFANRHREQRGAKASKASLLDEIPGIGPKLRNALLKRFGSITSIRAAKDEELREVLSELQVRELRRKLS
jgi:excinuclease ABC subunit C